MRRAELTSDVQDWIPFERPALDPNGNGLIFAGRSGDNTNLWRVPFSPIKFTIIGPPQRVTSGATREESPSAAGLINGTTRIAFTSFTETLAVWSLPIEPNQGKVTGEPKQLTHDGAGDFMPSISRDGSKIVFVSTRPGLQEVWTKDLRTGEEMAVTATRGPKWDPKFSPDGTQIAFGDGVGGDVFIVPSTGGAPKLVCNHCGEVTDWSLDGKHIIGNTADGRAWILDLVSREQRDLLATQRWIATDKFSRDGRWFGFRDWGPGGIHVYIAPTSEQPVPENGWIMAMDDAKILGWSPNGNLIYFTMWQDGYVCIWARHLQPVTKQPIGEPFAVFHAHSARLSFSNQIERTLGVGSNKLVFSMGERTGNIWMAEWKQQ